MATKKKNDVLIQSAALIGGALASRVVGSQLGKLLPASVPAQFGNIIPIALGIYLAGNKSEMAKAAGAGMIAAAGSRFLGELIPAIGAPMSSGAMKILQRTNTRSLGYPANQAILNRPANQAILQGTSGGMKEPNMRSF